MSMEFDLAQFVTQAKYEDFPHHILEVAKKDVFDTLGVALAGSGALGCREVLQVLTDSEKGGKCDVLVYGNKLSPQGAALVNSTMAHALDFDDTHDLGGLHAGVTVVPAAFAAAQHLGKINGKDFITAIILGMEIICRMGVATKPWIGWMLTPLYGYFGVATAVGKLLGLNEDGMLDAWGIAYAQAAGNLESSRSGALTKRIQAGFAASGGVLSALMASKGITGAKDSMDGKYGIINLYQRGDFDREAITADLGTKFEVANLSFKPYPCCRFLHTPIDAALKLVQEYNIAPEQIDEVIVEVSQTAYDGLCTPIEIKHKPRTSVDAQFSIPYTVATALAKRRVIIEDFTEEAIRDKDVLLITSKLRSEENPEITQRSGRAIAPTRLIVKANERVYSTSVEIAKGHPQNPMSDKELELKFRDCASHAAKRLSTSSVEKVIDMVRKLDEVGDVDQIVSLLA